MEPMGLILYTRRGCRLCDEAEDLLCGVPDLKCVDVDTSPELIRRYGLRVPVLVSEGKVLLEGRFSEDAVADLFGH
jgi:glutaredoxin